MELFELVTAQTVPDAIKAQAKSSTAQNGAEVRFIAGGTNLIDYMKLNVERPRQLIDINNLPLDKIETTADGGLKLGALARNADVAHDPTVKAQYVVLSQALLAGASPQLRNMATTGGICCRRRAAFIIETQQRHVTSASPAPAVPPLAAIIACWRFSVLVSTALQVTPLTKMLH